MSSASSCSRDDCAEDMQQNRIRRLLWLSACREPGRAARSVSFAPPEESFRNRDLHSNELTAEGLRPAIEDAAVPRCALEVEMAESACARPVLAEIRFGHHAPLATGALDIHVQLEALQGSPVS